ncbi:UNVERIFIED_CONTAM: hypothetical protein FKN15_057585 [Acipenser sinensis]
MISNTLRRTESRFPCVFISELEAQLAGSSSGQPTPESPSAQPTPEEGEEPGERGLGEHFHIASLWEDPSIPITIKELPQTTLTLEPPFPEIFTGETVTLRCGVERGSAGWKYLWYKDSEDTPVLQTAGRSITGDSYTITAAAVSDQGQYCC